MESRLYFIRLYLRISIAARVDLGSTLEERTSGVPMNLGAYLRTTITDFLLLFR